MASVSHRLVVVGVTLGILGAIGVAIIIWWTIRMKPGDGYAYDDHTPVSIPAANPRRPSLTLNTATAKLSHSKSLALKITPFNPSSSLAMDSTKLSSGDGPRFVHTPGANMRIATRLSNGVWQFSEPLRGRKLGEMNPYAGASQTSLLPRSGSPSPGPHSPSPLTINANVNPFSDSNATSPSTADHPMTPFTPVDSTKPYPFSRPKPRIQTKTQTQSIFRGTIYDLSPQSMVPSGIHDLDDEIRRHQGRPLPVAESELMRRGLRNSVGAAGLLQSPVRQNSNDSVYSLSLARRTSGSAQVLLGGTGPVGVGRTPATQTYHPDLDEVVDISQDEEDGSEGEETPPSSPNPALPSSARLGPGHASALSTSTLGTLATTINTHAPSSYGIGITNPYASTSTVYLGSLGHLTRPSFAASADSHLPPPPPPKLPSSLLSTETNLNLPSSSQPRPQSHSQPYSTVYLPSPSASSTTFSHATHSKKRGSESTFDSEAHGYGYGYGVAAHEKKKETEKAHGHQYQVGLGVDDVYAADESLSSYYEDDESQYDDTVEGDGDTTLHTPHSASATSSTSTARLPTTNINIIPPTPVPKSSASERERGRGRAARTGAARSADVVDIPPVPPPAYLSPREERFKSTSRERDGRL